MHDVFVSYARVDDESPTGSGQGWVTTFEHWLCEALKRPLGRRPDIWMDWQLAANAPLTATLLEEVGNSLSLVLILSPGYQKSQWCEFELNHFLGQHPPVGGREAVFVVEIYPVDRQRLPARVQELVPVQFWEPGIDDRVPRTLGWPAVDPDEHNPYWRQIERLAYQIAHQIADQISKPITRVLEAPTPPRAAPIVWIADPTPKVAEYWDELAGAITRNGGTVRPRARGGYPLSEAIALKDAVQRDAVEAGLLVELVADETGPRLPNSIGTLATIQHAAAREVQQCGAGVSFLRWRPPEIDLSRITEPELGEMLFGATRSGFEEFRRTVLGALDQLKTPHPPAPQGRMVCLTAGEHDQPLCDEVSGLLETLGWTVCPLPARPAEGQTPEDFRKQADEVIQATDIAILLYGRESPAWIQAQYVRMSKLLGHGPPLIVGPPPGKAAVPVRGRDLIVFQGQGGIDAEELAAVIDRLKGSHDA